MPPFQDREAGDLSRGRIVFIRLSEDLLARIQPQHVHDDDHDDYEDPGHEAHHPGHHEYDDEEQEDGEDGEDREQEDGEAAFPNLPGSSLPGPSLPGLRRPLCLIRQFPFP
jgi:hypothetical protein